MRRSSLKLWLGIVGVTIAGLGPLNPAPSNADSVIVHDHHHHHPPIEFAPPPPPRRYVLLHPRPAPRPVVVHYTPPPPVVRRVTVVTPLPSEPEPIEASRDPYDTSGIVVVGTGASAMLLFGDGFLGSAALGYRLHLGLAVDQAEFALDADLVPGVTLALTDTQTDGSLVGATASFNYRFLPGADVHPVFGIGLASTFLDFEGVGGGASFAVAGRVGLELAYPLDDGALALGIDVRGTSPFASTKELAIEAPTTLGLGAYVNYRF